MPMVDGKKYPYTKKGKAAADKARQGKFGGGMNFGNGIETTDAFQLPGRIMGTAPRQSTKPRGISGAKQYSAPPKQLPKMGNRNLFHSGGVAKPN